MLISTNTAARLAYGVDRAIQANAVSPVLVAHWSLATNATKETWKRYITVWRHRGRTSPALDAGAARDDAFAAVMDVCFPSILGLAGSIHGQIASFTISPTTDLLDLSSDATQQITITVPLDAYGDVATGTFTYATTDAAKATVSASGLVTAVAVGTCTITVTSNTGVARTLAITVQA